MHQKVVLLFFFALALSKAQAQKEDSLMIRRIFDEALLRGRCYEHLRVLCANGPRLSGSVGADRAVQIMADAMQQDGMDKVMLQPVMVPKWERGKVEKCEAVIA